MRRTNTALADDLVGHVLRFVTTKSATLRTARILKEHGPALLVLAVEPTTLWTGPALLPGVSDPEEYWCEWVPLEHIRAEVFGTLVTIIEEEEE